MKDGVGWQPVENAPLDKSVLMWWRPRADPKYPHPPEHASPLSNNRYAEACVIGQVSHSNPGQWWNGQTGKLQDLWHVTHWRPLPSGPY